jgi:hypothetical protein
MPLAKSENGAAMFLIEGSDEWKAYEAATGQPMLAHSTVSGYKGRWVRPNPADHQTPPRPAKQDSSPDPSSPPISEAERQRIGERFDALMAEMVAMKAGENAKPPDPDTVHGATAEETERLTAQAKLDRWAANPEPLPKPSQAALKAAGLKPERKAKTFTQEEP